MGNYGSREFEYCDLVRFSGPSLDEIGCNPSFMSIRWFGHN